MQKRIVSCARPSRIKNKVHDSFIQLGGSADTQAFYFLALIGDGCDGE